MKKLTIIWVLIIGLFSCEKDIGPTEQITCDHPLLGNAHSKSRDFQNILETYVAIGFPGASLLVQDDEGIWVGSAGFADIREGVPFTPCHISKAASITKLMVGVLTMKLQEEGVLDIDDPVSNYIDKDVLDKIDHPKGMTLKQLMNHTTGIYDLISDNGFYLAVINNPNKEWRQEELLKFVYHKPRYKLTDEFPARYSNTNTLLLSMCINRATGKEHADLLRDYVLVPLGMDDTYYQGREKLPESAAQGYFDLHNNKGLTNVSNYITGSGNGYGGIYSNVFDLKKIQDALYRDRTLLSEASLNEMMESFYRYGNELNGDIFACVSMQKRYVDLPGYGIGHSGKDLGYSADMYYFPESGRSFILFVNYGTDADSYLRDSFYELERDIVLKMLE